MRMHERLPRGIRRLFRLPRSEQRLMRELDDEIQFHFERHISDLLSRGMSEADATAAALARFGDTDDLRAYCGRIVARRQRTRGLRDWFDELGQDVHFAARQIARSPAFTATATLILALGIGANAAIFSIVHHLILAPLPFAEGDRMVTLFATSSGGAVSITPTSDLAAAWQARARGVEQIVIYEDVGFALGDSTTGPPQQVLGEAIPPSAIPYIGIQPLFGRRILASDTAHDAPPVVLLGEGLWKRNFGGVRDVVGKSILLDGTKHTVIGVMPEKFYLPFSDGRDVFVPLHGRSEVHRVAGMAKLRRGVTIDAANRELENSFPPKSVGSSSAGPPRVKRAVDLVGSSTRRMVILLFGAVGIVLLIACANVANLLLARSWSRQREFAVRAALGAGRGRIMRQVFTESLILALIAGALGIAMSFVVLHGIQASLPADSTPFEGVRIERAVLFWSAGISVLAGILFGFAPALAAVGHRVNDSLKAGARTSAGSAGARRLRFGLVVGEVALSVTLLAGAGLLVRSLVALNRVDVGFQPHGLSAAFLRLSAKRFADSTVRRGVLTAILDGARRIPGVRGAMYVVSPPPHFAIAMNGLQIEDRSTAATDSLKTFGLNNVPPEFFAFVGLPIKQGRTFTPTSEAGDQAAPAEVLINEALAHRFWPNGGAIGTRVRRGEARWETVIGIVGNIRLPAATRLNGDLQMYQRAEGAPRGAFLLVRSELPFSAMGPALEKVTHDVDRSIKLGELEAADAEITASMATPRLVLKLLGAFAILAMVLAAMGLHGVIAYSVGQRTREIGVRVALGAQSRDVVRLVLGQGLALAVAGIAIGVAGSLAATRVLRTFLFDVQPGDPVTLAIVGVLLLLIAIAASYAPARRASRLDPVEALRAD